MTAARVFSLFAAAAALARDARAIEPSLAAGSNASASTTAESSFERAFRLGPVQPVPSVLAPAASAVPAANAPAPGDLLDAAARSDLFEEFRPRIVPPRDPDEVGTIPFHPALHDRFFLGVGAFLATSSTEARLDSSTGIGTTLDLEDVLGLPSSEVVPQGLARWRMSDRWRLELEYFSLDRENTRALGSDVVWGDHTFPAGTAITTSYDVSVLRLSCGYSFFKTQDKELGVALGFHLTDIKAKLVSTGSDTDDGTLLAPLPVISLYGQVALTDIWALSGRLDAFRLEYDPYAGHIYSIGLDVLCQPWRHVGFGVGWRGLDIEASADHGNFEGRVSSDFQGPIAFLAVSF